MFNKKANAFLCFFLVATSANPVMANETFSSEDIAFFESKVRPLLAEQCYKCHSQQAKKLKADLYLDSREGVLRGGDTGPAIKLGDSAHSLLMEAIRYRNPDLQMPPKTKLSNRDIEVLERWISLGAPWPNEPKATGVVRKEFDLAGRKASHWSWQPVKKTTLPAVKNQEWGKLPIDRFILAGLEKEGLSPAQTADRRTLLRRLTFDLRGMPPSSQEVQAFLEDDAPDAYEKVIDRLLASSQFGEKWARHWMDLFRYAESRGHEFDYNTPNAFRYRDYLIRALNDDLPYNQFVTEHVAGDLLEKPRLNPDTGANESVLATGFWFLGEWIHSPVDTRQDEADRFDNMIGVFSKSFLGLTVACARCHDHKFDAISTKDFYALQGYLQSSGYRQVRYESMLENERVSRDLDKLEQSAGLAKKISSALVANSRQVEKYMLAAGSIMRGEVAAKAEPPKREKSSGDEPIVFADFEDGTYGKWLSTGTAFGKRPVTLETKADYQKDIRQRGKYFVNSHNVRKDSAKGDLPLGDDQLGTLTSPLFRIQRDYVTFLIGGGSFKKETCVNLLIDGKAVLSAIGRSNNTMAETVWDVRKWKGTEARLQVVDKRKGSWGNVGMDHVVFTNQAKASSPSPVAQSGFKKGVVASFAKSQGLDGNLLQGWVDALYSAQKDRSDLLSPLAAVLGAKNPDWKLARAAYADATDRRTRYLDALSRLELAVNYASPRPGDFMQDGVTFGRRPKLPGDLLFNESGGLVGLARWGMARREPVWKGLRIVDSARDSGGGLNFVRAGITLRTPTFTNTHGDAHYLLRGKGKAVAVVDSHRLIQGPLHRNTSIDVGRPGQLAWVSQDLDRQGQTYLGHRLHVEFTPTTGDDFEVLMIDLSTDSGARNEVMGYLNNPPNPLYDGIDKLGELTTREQLTGLVASNFKSVSAKLAVGFGSEPKPQAVEFAKVADWLVRRKDSLGLGDSIPSKDFLERYRQLGGEIKKDSRTAMAMLDGSADNEYVFIRGNHRSRGDAVPRRYIEALGGLDTPTPKLGSGRLDLARQITNPQQTPFITRVMANRLWHHLFGRGIVASTDDFGVLGQSPTHPDLLDYLASRLVAHDWSVKAMIKEIVMSRTYRMSSGAGGLGEEKDPANLLWRRTNVRRLQAEAIRDSLLFLSGRLDSKMYGRPVSTYLTDFMQGRGRPGQGPVDGSGRRSIYLSVRRNFLSPFMLAFDAPSPFNAVGRRTTSNVPSQALILMNDPFVVGQASLWAKRIRGEAIEAKERIHNLYQSAFARPPSELEMNASLSFLTEQAKLHGVPEDNDLPWKDLVHAIINAKEFIFLN